LLVCIPYLLYHLLLWVQVMPWSIARLFVLVGCRSASLSEENCSLFLCAAAMFCAHLHLTAPYCPLLPHFTLFSPMRHRTAHLSPVPSRSLEIHAGEEKGGNGGGGATRARSWASGESCVGGSGGERGDGSEEHGGFFGLVPADSAPCLLGVNPLQLPPSRAGWTQAYGRVHAWKCAL